MTPQQRNQTIDDLFSRAVGLSREEQAALLVSSGVSECVRREVNELLDADRFLESNQSPAFGTGQLKLAEMVGIPLSGYTPDETTSVRELSTLPQTRNERWNAGTDGGVDQQVDAIAPITGPIRIGKFELLHVLGGGCYGQVWKAYDTELERFVALKVPREEIGQLFNRRMVEREAKAASKLQHPNLVAVYEVLIEHGRALIACQLIEGETLSKRLENQECTFRQAAMMCLKLSEAMQHAHSHGVIHRDLKPSNIIIDSDGEPHIADFGLAKRDLGNTTVSTEGNLLGTPAYMPPEQAQGNAKSADARSDIYSLGVILFQMLTAELPFRGDIQVVIQKVISADPPSPRSLKSNVPRDLETITLKCMEKSPSLRYQSAQALAADLRLWIENKPIVARPVGRFVRCWRFCTRHRSESVLAATIVCIVVLSFATVTSLWIRANKSQSNSVRHLQRRTANFETTIEAVEAMLTRVIERDDPRLDAIQRSLIQEALALYEDLLGPDEDDNDRRIENARVRMRIGNLYDALSETGNSIVAYEAAIEDFRAVISREPEAVETDELSECYRSVASCLLQMNATDDMHWLRCKSVLTQAMQIDEAAIVENPTRIRSLAQSQNLYAQSLLAQSDLLNAEREYGRAIELWKQAVQCEPESSISRMALVWSRHQLADLYLRQNELKKSRIIHLELLAERTMLQAELPDRYFFHPSPVVRIPSPKQVFSLRHDLAATHRSLGQICVAESDDRGAAEHYLSAARLLESVLKDYPDRETHMNAQAGIHTRLAQVMARLGDSKSALHHYEMSFAIRAKSPSREKNVRHLRAYAEQHVAAAAIAENIDVEEAENIDVEESVGLHLCAAREIYKVVREKAPDESAYHLDSIRVLLRLASLRFRMGDSEAASKLYDEARQVSENLKPSSESPDTGKRLSLQKAESMLSQYVLEIRPN